MEQITENPYLQYFIGLPGYQEEPPFDASTLVLFRKRLTHEIIMEANEYMLDHQGDDSPRRYPVPEKKRIRIPGMIRKNRRIVER